MMDSTCWHNKEKKENSLKKGTERYTDIYRDYFNLETNETLLRNYIFNETKMKISSF